MYSYSCTLRCHVVISSYKSCVCTEGPLDSDVRCRAPWRGLCGASQKHMCKQRNVVYLNSHYRHGWEPAAMSKKAVGETTPALNTKHM